MDVTLDHVEDIASNIKTFWFKPALPMEYKPGQFTAIRLPNDKHDDRGEKRWFTLSSSPSESLVSITTKFADNNLNKSSSFKSDLANMQPGAKLTLADAMGDFTLPEDKSTSIVLVAGGIGVTPYRSMVKWLTDMDDKRDITLIYSVSRIEELAFKELFDNYGVRLIPVVTNPEDGWQGEMGLLDAKRILGFIDGASNGQRIYLSGPEPMVEILDSDMKEQGIDASRIASDFFPGYTEV